MSAAPYLLCTGLLMVPGAPVADWEIGFVTSYLGPLCIERAGGNQPLWDKPVNATRTASRSDLLHELLCFVNGILLSST